MSAPSDPRGLGPACRAGARSSESARTGGEWVVAALRAEGVRHVFGIPGVHNLAVYDALLRQTEITHVLARHEQGAAFMADGYARASGLPGVVIVTTGPGATNTLTPLAESYAGSTPIVLVMSDIALPLVGRDLGALHEVPNQIDCFRPVCRLAEAISDTAAIAPTLAGAFDLLRTGRPGPVALSIPWDLLGARTEGPAPSGGHGVRPPCHVQDVAEAARLLAAARRPLVIAGGGVIAAGAEAEARALAARLDAPVIASVAGRGAIDERDPRFHGVLPDRRVCAPAIAAADVVLVVGCHLGHRSAEKLGPAFGPRQTVIHLDLDPGVIGRLVKTHLGLVGDARDGLVRLLAALGPARSASEWDPAWLAELRRDVNERYTPEVAALIATLRAALPEDAIVVNDQTGLTYWMEWKFPVLAPRTFLYPAGSAVLGYAVGAAIGAKIARPEQPVLAIAGDGGFMYSVNELATAVKYRLPIVYLVVNDGRYGAIKWLQELFYEGRWGEADLTNPDFVALARAFGARGERLASVDALPAALAAGFAADRPTVLELPRAVEPPWEF
ncbi:MAG: thiamine pyrophosphate-binding protein [Candidatus Rokubacteria bacterium]|nr:thiamine pyrophosphate-binding protein [Candidatus Rokubacteria bacterium]MBI3826560.1 thiamine pyrophosphate-binding protein [Candidatus Rokubacteria bacterium]